VPCTIFCETVTGLQALPVPVVEFAGIDPMELRAHRQRRPPPSSTVGSLVRGQAVQAPRGLRRWGTIVRGFA